MSIAKTYRTTLFAALLLTTLHGSAALATQQAQAKAEKPAVAGAAAETKPKAAAPPAASPAAKTASRGPQGSASGQSIVALVNDEPITGYEIQQRAAMLGGGNINAKAQANFQALIKDPKITERLKGILGDIIKANPGKSKDEIIEIFDKRKKEFGQSLQRQAVDQARASALPGMRKQALDELIDEKLKLQEAKRGNVVVSDDEVNKVINGIMERNKMTEAQFAQQLGGSLEPMKTRVRSTLSWNEVVRRRFGSQVFVASSEVDKFVATGAATAVDQAELQVQRIRIALPAKLDQAAVAQRVQEAEKIRAKFTDCKSSGAIATGVPGAKFEELGLRKPSSLPEPTRSMLLNAGDGEMLPPSVGDGGVELWIVCSRTIIKAADQQRNQAEGELKQKEFELLSKRHLKDLRQDAHIEYR